jgi:hypothetical protein
MRAALLVFLVWFPTASAQPAFRPPTATEVFNLRSRCAALGQKFLDELLVGSAISKTLTSHYDPRSNHCYGDVLTENIRRDVSYHNRSLFDLQTCEILAFAKIEKGLKVGMVFGRLSNMKDDFGFTDANEYIDQMTKEER